MTQLAVRAWSWSLISLNQIPGAIQDHRDPIVEFELAEGADILISTTVPNSLVVGNYSLCIVSDDDSSCGIATTGYGFDVNQVVARTKALFEHLERKASFADIGARLKSVQLEPEFLMSGLGDSFFNDKLSQEVEFLGCKFYSHRHSRRVDIPMYAKAPACADAEPIFPITSSGCASHENDSQAKERSILEIIERDAFFTSWYGNVASHIEPDNDATKDIFKNTPFDNGTNIKIYRLATTFNCFVYATILLNYTDGFLVGLGASLHKTEAMRKSAIEALYFFNWLNIFGPNKSDVMPFPVINDFDDHLYHFWFYGKQSYLQLSHGSQFRFDTPQSSFKYRDLLSGLNGGHYLFYRKLKTSDEIRHSVYRSYISHTIHQHTRYEEQWNLDFMRNRFPNFEQSWPVIGFHPFT